jgi:hypothetical protein
VDRRRLNVRKLGAAVSPVTLLNDLLCQFKVLDILED